MRAPWCVIGEVEVRGLEVDDLGGQLVDHGADAGREPAELVGSRAPHAHEIALEALVAMSGLVQRAGQDVQRRRSDTGRLAAGQAGGEVADRGLGQDAALADDDDLLDRLRDLGEHVAREQHRAAGCCEVAQRVPEPADAVGVEPVGRLVEDEDLRLAEQRAGQAEALAHAL